MKRTVFVSTIVLFISLIACAGVWAQATAQISGTARDQSGAVLPGVEVKVTQTETGVTRTAVTNETGSYVLPNLAVGPYRLEAALPGFRTYLQSGIVLQVNASPVINIVLEVGQVAEQVEVQANAALVDTRNSTVGSVIENERVLELPLNGRNVTDLIALAGGTVDQSTGSQSINVMASFTAICLSFCVTTCSTPGTISRRSPALTNEISLVEPRAARSCKTSCFSSQGTKEPQSGRIHRTSELLFPRQRC